MATTKVTHPAKYSDALLPVMAGMLTGCSSVLDPFAGSGKIFDLDQYLPGTEISAIELEPEFAAMHPKTQLGNALHLPWPDDTFGAICTSPVFGNRMSDHHEARDDSKRNTYTHCIGRKLHPDNAGAMHWGPAYWDFHIRAWYEARRVLKIGGTFVLNIKDFYRTVPASKMKKPYYEVTVEEKHNRVRTRVHVTAWHCDCLRLMGFQPVETVEVPLKGNGYGANGNVRAPYESVIKFRLESKE